MYEDDDIPRRRPRKGGGGAGIAYMGIFALVVGGVWYMWNGGFDTKKVKRLISGDLFKASAGGATTTTQGYAESIKEKSASVVQSGLDIFIEKPKEIATGLLKDVKEAAVDSARKEAAKVLGVPVGTLGEDPGVSIVRPVQQNLSLLMGANAEDLLYAIDWGDTQTATGSVKKGESKAIDHAWATAGEYVITVVVTGNATGKKTYSFPVTIQK